MEYQRDQLFKGARAERLPNASSSTAGASLWGRQASLNTRPDGAAMRGVLEEDNDRLISDLEHKVAALKGATAGIHDEVRTLTGDKATLHDDPALYLPPVIVAAGDRSKSSSWRYARRLLQSRQPNVWNTEAAR